jgi:uncharacterized small protein (DUF1192 family)
MNKIAALHSLRPKASWCLNDDELDWLDTEQVQPTDAEITTEIARLEAEYERTEYQRKRAAEYPPMADYLDAVVKGDQAQIDAYVAACQAVKAKYPKPE